MATTPALFKVRFPEFTAVDDTRIQMFLDDAALCIDENVFGKFTDIATCYLAAHLLYIADESTAGNGSASTEVTENNLGNDLIERYQLRQQKSTVASDFLNRTNYGQQYLGYVRKVTIGFMVIQSSF